jgi:hypothetical protein
VVHLDFTAQLASSVALGNLFSVTPIVGYARLPVWLRTQACCCMPAATAAKARNLLEFQTSQRVVKPKEPGRRPIAGALRT